MLTGPQTPPPTQNVNHTALKTWQDSLTTKSNTFQGVAIGTEPEEKEDVGNITFHNCTFNISAGGDGKQIDVKKIITDVVARIKNSMGMYKKGTQVKIQSES